jgi:hypothetical protein
MMRKLVFKADDSDMFRLLHQGFFLGAPEGGLRGLSAHRTAMKLMDKIETISEQKKVEGKPEVYPTGDQIRNLLGPCELILNDSEHEMLKKHFSNVPWRVAYSRQVVAIMEFLDNAEEV